MASNQQHTARLPRGPPVLRAHPLLAPTPAARPQLKLNTDESPNVATEYGIRSIPTVMVFKNGAWLAGWVGRRGLGAAMLQGSRQAGRAHLLKHARCRRWNVIEAHGNTHTQRRRAGLHRPPLTPPPAPLPPTPSGAGQKMDAVIGAVPKGTLVQTVEKYLD